MKPSATVHHSLLCISLKTWWWFMVTFLINVLPPAGIEESQAPDGCDVTLSSEGTELPPGWCAVVLHCWASLSQSFFFFFNSSWEMGYAVECLCLSLPLDYLIGSYLYTGIRFNYGCIFSGLMILLWSFPFILHFLGYIINHNSRVGNCLSLLPFLSSLLATVFPLNVQCLLTWFAE